MDDNQTTTVEIFGREYKIKGVADEAYIQTVAKYVDGKMKEVSQGSSLPTQDRLAILAALNIADELFQERADSSRAISSIEQKTNKLISILDESFPTKD